MEQVDAERKKRRRVCSFTGGAGLTSLYRLCCRLGKLLIFFIIR